MAQAPITAEMVTEAGIAAHLAANPNLLPPEISELSDQAAIFASNNTNAFMFTGSADADSENTNFGESLATKAIENVIRLEAERRKEDDPDASIIAEAGAAMRENLLEMQTVSVGGITLTGEEIQERMEMLNDPEKRERAAQDYAARNNVSIEQARTDVNWYHQVMSLMEKKSNGTITPEEEARLNSMSSEPGFADRFNRVDQSFRNVANDQDITIANRADQVAQAAPEVVVEAATEGTVIEQDALVTAIDSEETQRLALDRRGYATAEIDDLQGWGSANSESLDLAAEFGIPASGVQVAALEEEPAATVTSPVLGRG